MLKCFEKEFKEKSEEPIHYKYYSCRQMAYDHNMPNIVTLIDFFNDKTNRKIVKYLGRNLIKSNLVRNKESNLKLLKKEQSKLLDKRLEAFMKSDYFHPSSENLKDGSSGLNNESALYDDIESVKPGSLYSLDESIDELDQEVQEIERKAADRNKSGKKNKGKQASIYEEVEYLSSANPSIDADGLLELDPKYEILLTSQLNKNIKQRLSEKQSNNVISFDKPKRKDFSYKGFKIGFNIDYTADTSYSSKYSDIVNQKRPQKTTETNSMESIFQQSVAKLNESPYLRVQNNDVLINNSRSKSRLNETPIPKSILNESLVLRKKSLLLTETPITKFNESSSLQPKSTINEYKTQIKRNSTLNENDLSIRESRISSSRGDIPGLFNSVISKHSAILNRDEFSSIDLKNKTSPIKNLQRNSTVRKQKPMIQSYFLTKPTPIKLKLAQKSSLNYKDSYLKTLKKSGLSNEYCVPNIRSINFIAAK